ncbi:MAG: SusC/RagA family TonB-linked outer membrane protein [Chitinophagaceae bacterium]|nr:MAG: SusC/RagA family TonB-linked outer membrane protein [Chitinophagaceae bacterium]
MKKFKRVNEIFHLQGVKKFLLVMKISTLLIFIGCMQVSARAFSQNNTVTLNMDHVEIAKALKEIEKKSDYRFLYNDALLSPGMTVNIHAEGVSVPHVMDQILSGTELTYKIIGTHLIVIAARNSEIEGIHLKGTVTDSTGTVLAGVTIQVKGTTVGSVTDASGKFEMEVPDNAILIVSSVGFITQEIPVNGQSNLTIVLRTSNSGLNEVVVIGYGSQEKKDLTGAVSVVSSKEIANRPIVNLGEALQGQASGVEVTSNSGKPGAGLTIRVRGSSSISAGNDPLYVVDGIPMTDVSTINPDDIQSISVLKDAASAAIYGTRAANGVVVITTKKGKSGQSNINFSAYYGVTSPTKMLPVLNAKQYQDYANEQKGSQVITDSMVQANDINWPDQVFRHGYQQNYQLSFSGGSEKTQHYISLNYMDQVGMIKPATYNRWSGRLNLSTQAAKWLKLSTNTTLTQSHNHDVTDNASVARGGVVLSALETPPTVPKFNPDGTIGINPLTGWENPLGAILGRYNKNLTNRLISDLNAEVTIWKGLAFKSRFGLDYGNYTDTYFLDPFLTTYGRQTGGQQSRTITNNLTWLSEQLLTYSAVWGKSSFSALAGWTAQNSNTTATTISGSFLNPIYRHLPWEEMYLRDSIKAPGTTAVDEWALMSYLGRVTYNYADKYLFEANIREDQSSKFAQGNRSAVFPSFSAGWRISQESFMQNITPVSDLKIRVSWGQNGNQEGIGSYSYLPLSNVDPITGAVTAATIAPKSLTWETTTQTDIGVDAVLLNGRISFSGDYYTKKTKNVLINIPLPSQAGFSTAPVNAASMQNTGEEFLISTKNVVKPHLQWNTSLNISFNQNKILSIGEGIKFMNAYGNIYTRGNSIALVQGYGLGEFYGYVADGVDPQTGHELYLTKGKTKTDNPNPSDRVLMGSAQPQFVYGLSNDVTYNHFNLTVFIEGSQGNKIFNAGQLEAEAMVNSANQSTAVLKRWRKPGDITTVPGVSTNGSTNNSLISTRFLENGSYLRFKTITLSYSFTPAILEKVGMKAASVYISANNLFTITKYQGFDPEVNSYGNPGNSNDDRNISLGVDNGAYPQAKMFIFGLNLDLK